MAGRPGESRPSADLPISLTTRRQDRALSIVSTLTLLVTVSVLILAIVATPILLNTSDAAEQVADGNEVSACRGQVRTEVDRAITNTFSAKTELDLLSNRLTEALISGDAFQADALQMQIPDARENVEVSMVSLRAAADLYDQAAEFAVADPEGFVAQCNG